jgi:hypothetical protein
VEARTPTGSRGSVKTFVIRDLLSQGFSRSPIRSAGAQVLSRVESRRAVRPEHRHVMEGGRAGRMSGCPPGRQCRSKAARTWYSPKIRGWSARTWRCWPARACQPADLRWPAPGPAVDRPAHRCDPRGSHFGRRRCAASLATPCTWGEAGGPTARATPRTAGAPLGCTVICRPAEQPAAPEVRGDSPE